MFHQLIRNDFFTFLNYFNVNAMEENLQNQVNIEPILSLMARCEMCPTSECHKMESQISSYNVRTLEHLRGSRRILLPDNF